MDQAENNITPIAPRRFTIEADTLLNGTSADIRFLTNVEYSAVQSSYVFEIIPAGQQDDWERDYQPLLKRSAVLDELQKQSV
jgi:hypothetical protein